MVGYYFDILFPFKEPKVKLKFNPELQALCDGMLLFFYALSGE